MELNKMIKISVLLAIGIILNIIDSYMMFLSNVIPGLRIGLTNIITLFVIYNFTFKESLGYVLLRILVVGILRTGLFSVTFFLSLGGSLLSLIMMSIMKRIKLFSVIGVSLVGAISHSIGQVLVAMLLFDSKVFIYYLPYILLFSISAGIIIGYVANKLIEQYQKIAV